MTLPLNSVDNTSPVEIPRGNWSGFLRYAQFDVRAGLLVFLIALPLSLGIASACGYPPISGIFTAILGGIIGTLLSNSELTIKGPAAGLIVIAMGCIQDFGGNGLSGGWDVADQRAFRLALGVGVAAAAIQILLGLFRAGILGEFFPLAAVHGMLAAIGLIIIAKQVPVMLGIDASGEPLELLEALPKEILGMNPEIALIGGISLLILVGLPLIKNRFVRMIPAPMLVLVIAVPLGIWLDLDHTHTYTFGQHKYEINSERHLVNVPENMFQAITYPDFTGLMEPKAWKWVALFAIIGSLESMLSAKAIDTLDPWKRTTSLDRDNLAIGVGNLIAALVGGLPMISEIVRSKANIDNGARTRFSNLYHGLCLLLFVATVPWLIHRIPMAALGAMLVYTGFRLASPREFAHAYDIGRDQLVIFVVTMVGVLATDLIMGIVMGIGVKFLIHYIHGLPLRSIFVPPISVEEPDEKTYLVRVREAAVFTNWIPLRRRIERLHGDRDVVVDLSGTCLVDHTVLEKLHELEREFQQDHYGLVITGLTDHDPFSKHPRAARRNGRI